MSTTSSLHDMVQDQASSPYEVLLYYLYTELEDPQEYARQHRALCRELGLLGRILIAHEGINGTVSGTCEACERYRDALCEDPRTAGVEFKVDAAEGHAFPRLSIKVREEVVTLGLGGEDFSPQETTGRHLKPHEWREMMERDDTVLLDARNDYEWEMGHFRGALLPDIGNFRELPEWVRRNREQLEGKKILTYCTGGIRCEKFSGFLKREGFRDVYQLEGGIVTYGKDAETRGEGFEGHCYVFDERIHVPVNRTPGARIISRCHYCGEPTEQQVNCRWATCNHRHFVCPGCQRSRFLYHTGQCREAEVMMAASYDEL